MILLTAAIDCVSLHVKHVSAITMLYNFVIIGLR